MSADGAGPKFVARVRDGTIDDLAACVALGERMTHEVRYADFPYDRDFTFANVKHMLDVGGAAVFFVVMEVEGHGVQGFMFGYLTPYKIIRDFYADEELLYIAPEFRGGMAVARMVKSFFDWAKAKGAREAYSATHTGNHLDALYERLGATRLGSTFQIVFRTGGVPA